VLLAGFASPTSYHRGRVVETQSSAAASSSRRPPAGHLDRTAGQYVEDERRHAAVRPVAVEGEDDEPQV